MSGERQRGGVVGRHKAVFALVALGVILVGLVAGWGVYLNQQIGNVPRMNLHLNEAARPERPSGTGADAINILLAGADSGDSTGPTIAESLTAGTWQPGAFRSDTIMILHLTADRHHAYLISVPRDSWVDVPGYGTHKINAAFSFGGPSLYVQTLEQFTGLRMDHLAVIDWDGFRDLTTALGGATVYIPETTRDDAGNVWEKGEHTLEGNEALRYVRQRHGLSGGDLDRIDRQQNLMRSLMTKTLTKDTLLNPVRLTRTIKAVAGNLVVDDAFGTGEMRSIATSLRGLRTGDVTFLTIPITGFDRIDGQSVIRVDQHQVRQLFGAVLADELDEYVAVHHADLLGTPDSVS